MRVSSLTDRRRPAWLVRATVCVAAACGWLVLAPWPGWADDVPTPSPNPLELDVGRLEQASRARVTGEAASAMLFNPADEAALARAGRRQEAQRAVQVGRLFVTKAGGLLPVEPATGLFAAASYHPATATATTTSRVGVSAAGSDQAGGPLGAGGLVGLAGGGLLVGAGIVCSVRVGRGESLDG